MKVWRMLFLSVWLVFLWLEFQKALFSILFVLIDLFLSLESFSEAVKRLFFDLFGSEVLSLVQV